MNINHKETQSSRETVVKFTVSTTALEKAWHIFFCKQAIKVDLRSLVLCALCDSVVFFRKPPGLIVKLRILTVEIAIHPTPSNQKSQQIATQIIAILHSSSANDPKEINLVGDIDQFIVVHLIVTS